MELRTTYNPILNDEFENDLEIKNFNETDKNQQIVILKGEFQVPRLINNLFYIFKGNKYYVRNQVIDKLVYLVKNKKQVLKLYNTETGKPTTSGEGAKIRVVSNKNSIALRTATMQITANREKAYLMNDEHIVYATNLFSFNKNFDSLLLILAKYAFNSLTKIEATQDDFEKKHYEWRDNTLIDKINGFFGVNFSMINEDQVADFSDDYFIKFRLRTKDVFGPYLIVPKDEFEKKTFSKTIVGSFQKIFEQYCGGYNPKTETKIPCFIKEINSNNEDVVTVENFINRPCVFIELLYHQMMAITKGRTYHEKYNKINGLLLSIKRLIQPNTFRINHSEINEPIENFLELMRYVLVNYDSLLAIDQLDLGNKKIRTSESVVYHLRIKIASILFKLFTEENLTLRTLKLIFLSIGENKKMLIDDLIKNDLLVYNNNTNEINSFLSLKMTFGGRGGLSKNVPTEMRGIHPTYVGKISLVASSNRNPGITSTLVPFTTIDENGFFTKPDMIDKNKFLK